MKAYSALGLVLALSAAGSHASEFDFNISDESVQASLTYVPAARSLDLGVGYIYEEGGTDVGYAEFHARGRTALGNLPTTVGIGLQFNAFDDDKADGTAVAIGGYTHLKIPSVPGLGFNLGAHFAPSITSFGDSDHYLHWDAKFTYRVIQTADIYAGYRQIKLGREHDSVISLAEGAMVGFRLYF